MKSAKKKTTFYVGMIVVILLVLGITYAATSTSIALNIGTGEYGVDDSIYGDTRFDASNIDFVPILDSEVETSSDNVIKIDFKVRGSQKNPTNKSIIYDIALADLGVDCALLNGDYIKWKLLKNGNQISSGSLGYSFDTITSNRMVLTTIQQDLKAYNATADNYTFYLWFSDFCQETNMTNCELDYDLMEKQESLLNRYLFGKIEVELYTGNKKALVRKPKTSLDSTTCGEILLNKAAVGSYVKYTGTGGTVGSTDIACKNNGSASSSTATAETEAANSCSGQNAREDIENFEDSYGYCYNASANSKYRTTGWRLAYIDGDSKPVIVSAGSPECVARTASTGNETYMRLANTRSLKYCNVNFVDGDCKCVDSNSDGICDIESGDAWAMNDDDFYNMTKAINGGTGKRIMVDSSDSLFCKYSNSKECGASNDLINNGGYYGFAVGEAAYWDPVNKYVNGSDYTSAMGIRPVISLASTVVITGGLGTMEDPYTIENREIYVNQIEPGSYVKYTGTGGTVGEVEVVCKNNGSTSSSTATAETEAANSCSGQNAREDLESSGSKTYGYCHSSSYKFKTTGWRVAYIDSNDKAVIVSAGSPECNTRTVSTGNASYIKLANTKAMKYCNSDFVDGDCSCLDSDNDGYCDCTDTNSNGICDEVENSEVDTWAIGDIDFYNITKYISGYGKRLTSESSTLGEVGGDLGDVLYCRNSTSKQCGYSNNLINNGGRYWFAAYHTSSGDRAVALEDGMIGGGISGTFAYGLRPMVRLASTVKVIGGKGTMSNPYILDSGIRDNVAPVCNITGPTGTTYNGYIKNGNSLTYTITCTDDSGSVTPNLTTSDLVSSNTGVMTVTSVAEPVAVSGGYSWNVTVTAGSTTGNATLSLNAGVITDALGNGNASVSGLDAVYTDNDAPTCGSPSYANGASGSSSTSKYLSSKTVSVSCSDSLSGCVNSSYSKSVSSNGSGSITIADKVGNTKSCSYSVSGIYSFSISSSKSSGDYQCCMGKWHDYRFDFSISASGYGLSSGKLCYSGNSSSASSACGNYSSSTDTGFGSACFYSSSSWSFFRSSLCAYAYACNSNGNCIEKYQC